MNYICKFFSYAVSLAIYARMIVLVKRIKNSKLGLAAFYFSTFTYFLVPLHLLFPVITTPIYEFAKTILIKQPAFLAASIGLVAFMLYSAITIVWHYKMVLCNQLHPMAQYAAKIIFIYIIAFVSLDKATDVVTNIFGVSAHHFPLTFGLSGAYYYIFKISYFSSITISVGLVVILTTTLTIRVSALFKRSKSLGNGILHTTFKQLQGSDLDVKKNNGHFTKDILSNIYNLTSVFGLMYVIFNVGTDDLIEAAIPRLTLNFDFSQNNICYEERFRGNAFKSYKEIGNNQALMYNEETKTLTTIKCTTMVNKRLNL